ncbi:hypothetical protein A2865_03900 [Candidatus Woesebacteria bacterium RIFCSPHIGHO2_01_FULL_39_17]|uniref:Uncharacterized protein n=2 Tax=Candidatus Woeseibacteriota TaxID=1752722 RepID=A0A0G0NMX2_9BACT|nr:MAG: hypothetical protein US72_C0001G0023 [Microgenomates group bacterium GW2011_GWC1_38_12]KKR14126.1 MAG: hypothetical protein UT40_C0005G0055 [Candidatus Woesebacteria bacterium GW2011_GWA1_39_21b]OGM23571.1 MAG: hypothetical protein A2865_03900 [Candidatus Woesebacteria bacterium RIFCSPHIGHO2_01_FULL_39_17]OGM63016.1 MAG: hypothetical protein A3A52_03430 [Candidatus Woesebacteria bacterium RIFCSPLOWO2_01_FULL_39_14]
MNWVTTNIRLPEDMYMELKMEAAKKRKSVAQLIRERIVKKKTSSKKDVSKLIAEMNKFAKKMSRKYPDLRLSEKLIEMRYEQ